MRITVIAVGVLLCSAATAEPHPWMKKETPETLHALVVVEEDLCPISTEEVKAISDAVISSAGLRPARSGLEIINQTVFFAVTVNCKAVGDGGHYAFAVEIQFARKTFDRVLLEYYPRYGALGLAEVEGLREFLTLGVSNLLVDYIKANFDLTPKQ